MKNSNFSEERLKFEKNSILKIVKELESSRYWVHNGDEYCPKYKMNIEDRVASLGIHICPFPFEQVLNFMANPDALGKINPQLKELTILYKKGDAHIVHLEYWGYGPVGNRDFVNVVFLVREATNKAYIITRSIDYPCAEKEGVTRGEVFVGAYILEKQDSKSTKVSYISDADLKGWIPGFLKNLVSEHEAITAFKVYQALIKQQR